VRERERHHKPYKRRGKKEKERKERGKRKRGKRKQQRKGIKPWMDLDLISLKSISSGKKRCIKAQRASPSVQEAAKFSTKTPG